MAGSATSPSAAETRAERAMLDRNWTVVPNPDVPLASGMLARVAPRVRPETPTVLIPDEAQAVEQAGRTVLVVDAVCVVESRPRAIVAARTREMHVALDQTSRGRLG